MESKINSFSNLDKEKGFKLIHMNVRSLSKKIDQLRVMTTGLNLDVLTVSETWLNSSVSSATVALEGYTLYRQDREVRTNKGLKKRGGGLLTYIRSKYAADSEQLIDMNASTRDIEVQWIIISREHCKDVIVCNVNRPPNGNLVKAIGYIDECIKLFDLNEAEIFMLDDMNVNYKNKVSGDYKKLKFFMQSNGLSQLITNTTRNTNKTKSLLDLILTNSKYISLSGTLEHFLSDHQPIFFIK